MRISVLSPSIRPQGLEIVRTGLLQQTFTDFEWLTEIGLAKHDLNSAYNRMLKRAKGELVVSLQDYLKIEPDYLQKFWDAYLTNPKAFITAPVGKVDNLVYNGGITWDWRNKGENEAIRPCNWTEWEIDSGCAPLVALKQIGGFDEALDGKWSLDNVNVGKRAFLAGYEFEVLPSNKAVVYDHDAHMVHPFRNSFDSTLNTKRMVMFEAGMTLPPL